MFPVMQIPSTPLVRPNCTSREAGPLDWPRGNATELKSKFNVRKKYAGMRTETRSNNWPVSFSSWGNLKKKNIRGKSGINFRGKGLRFSCYKLCSRSFCLALHAAYCVCWAKWLEVTLHQRRIGDLYGWNPCFNSSKDWRRYLAPSKYWPTTRNKVSHRYSERRYSHWNEKWGHLWNQAYF